MNKIDTSVIKKVEVEIDGKKYDVAMKTIGICEEINAIVEDAKRNNNGYVSPEKMMDTVGIILGKDAQEEIFPNGQDENYDRIILIHNGVREAFDYNTNLLDRMKAEKEIKQKLEPLDTLSRKMSPISEIGKMIK